MIDGSKSLRRTVRDVLDRPVIQRCAEMRDTDHSPWTELGRHPPGAQLLDKHLEMLVSRTAPSSAAVGAPTGPKWVSVNSAGQVEPPPDSLQNPQSPTVNLETAYVEQKTMESAEGMNMCSPSGDRPRRSTTPRPQATPLRDYGEAQQQTAAWDQLPYERCHRWYLRECPKGIAVSQLFDKINFLPVVYMPCSPINRGDEELSVDLRRTRDGKLALLVYSALDRLVTCCGEQQPWVVLPAANLEKIREKTDFELIMLDIEIPDEFRRHGLLEANS